MTSERFVSGVSKEAFDAAPLNEGDREVLYMEDIQNLLLQIPSNLDQKPAYDRYQSFEFNFETIYDTALPDMIAHLVKSGWEVSANVQFNHLMQDSQSTLGVYFTLNHIREEDRTPEQIDITSKLNPAEGTYDSTLIRREGLYVVEESDLQVVEPDEVYHFLASVVTRGDESMALSYISQPAQFRRFLHNPFSLDQAYRLFHKHADGSFKQNLYELDDPLTTLPSDMIVTYDEDKLIQIETQLWNDHEKKSAIDINLVTEVPEINQQPSESAGEMDFFFGKDSPKIGVPVYNKNITFEIGGRIYQPPLQDLDEIHSRLMSTVDFIAPPVVEVPYDDTMLGGSAKPERL